MQSSSEQPLVGEERYVTTRITAAKETNLSLDIICSSKLTVFLELRFPEQIMSADKYPSIFSRQMKAIVYL